MPSAAQGIFCLLFVAAWTKSKASGGTRPACFKSFVHLKSKKEAHIRIHPKNTLSPLQHN